MPQRGHAAAWANLFTHMPFPSAATWWCGLTTLRSCHFPTPPRNDSPVCVPAASKRHHTAGLVYLFAYLLCSWAAIRWPRYNGSHMCHIPRVPLGSPVRTFAVSHGRHTVVLARLFTHVPVPAPRGGRVYSPLCYVPVPRCGRAVMPLGCISVLCVAWVPCPRAASWLPGHTCHVLAPPHSGLGSLLCSCVMFQYHHIAAWACMLTHVPYFNTNTLRCRHSCVVCGIGMHDLIPAVYKALAFNGTDSCVCS